MTDGRTDGQTDGRTEAIAISPTLLEIISKAQISKII